VQVTGERISSCGFFLGKTAQLGSPRTYVVLGVPRGGTSMCAGALRLAGIHMGAEITVNTNEDRDFVAHGGDIALFDHPEGQEKYLAQLREVIASRNGSHEVWGWKDPVSALYLDRILGDLRNPHLILIMRDSAAVAMREWVALPQSHIGDVSPYFYFDHLERTVHLYSRAIETVKSSGLPGLVLSYERCLRQPADFARRILAFTGAAERPDADDLAARIAGYVTPDAVTGRLTPAQNNEIPARSLRNDLSFYGSLDDAYRACATLVNTREYSDALTLSSSILAAGMAGQRVAPQFVVPALRFAGIEGGLRFIRAVAFTNTGEPVRALNEVLHYNTTRTFLAKNGIADPMVENLSEPVERLQQTLETTLFGAKAAAS
jgi:hypothetical protein